MRKDPKKTLRGIAEPRRRGKPTTKGGAAEGTAPSAHAHRDSSAATPRAPSAPGAEPRAAAAEVTAPSVRAHRDSSARTLRVPPAPGADELVLRPMRWQDDSLYLLDQRRLPNQELWLRLEHEDEVASAIRDMMVRGAPAIGCAAAYGVALFAQRAARARPPPSPRAFTAALDQVIGDLAATWPTAVNLAWALGEMRAAARVALATDSMHAAAGALVARAQMIQADDIARCRKIGQLGALLLPRRATVLTHCNAGALATGGYGTALGVLRAARAAGKVIKVLADETRPYLQGARLTAWELVRENFEVTVIPDAAAAHVMARGEVTCVVVGADRIAANGDVANKIGTYGLAVAARRHQVPFYVAAPLSTVDLATPTGARIPIEERAARELIEFEGVRLAPVGALGRYPAFDVTPAELIDAIITEAGVIEAPFAVALAALAGPR